MTFPYKHLMTPAKTISSQSFMRYFFSILLALSVLFNIFTALDFSRHRPCRSFSGSAAELTRLLEVRMEEAKTMKGVISFLAQPAVNELNFSQILGREACPVRTRLLITVPSLPANAEKRKSIRNKVWRFTHDSKVPTEMAFFLGAPVVDGVFDAETQNAVEDESKYYKDVVQEDYADVHRNLRLKAMSMLRWASTRCAMAENVVRMDDDVDLDFDRVLATVQKTRGIYANFIVGLKVINDTPSRTEEGDEGPRYISAKEFPSARFPNYLLGTYQASPMSSVQLLYQATLRVKPIWLEDVFITGMCAYRVDVALVNDDNSSYLHLQW